jgi:hypothetical protein
MPFVPAIQSRRRQGAIRPTRFRVRAARTSDTYSFLLNTGRIRDQSHLVH